ncbi:MAG: DUF1801 domain-containing protein [Agriterribacter sp.]
MKQSRSHTAQAEVIAFLSNYNQDVRENALAIRALIFETLDDIMEQIDLPAKMIAYCYGQRYADMICTLIPSKKGLKLAFYRGADLPDPNGLLQGNGKLSRYIQIAPCNSLMQQSVKAFLQQAYKAYRQRMNEDCGGAE